jgi:hypothetical protein
VSGLSANAKSSNGFNGAKKSDGFVNVKKEVTKSDIMTFAEGPVEAAAEQAPS